MAVALHSAFPREVSVIARILHATDFAATARKAESLALDIARASGGCVVLLHAIEPIDPDGDQAPFQEFYAGLRVKAGELMGESVQRFLGAGVKCEARIVVARRWKAILEAAEAEDADLVVMGGRTFLDEGHLDVGTTSHKVFLASHRPVLFVRAESKTNA